MKLIFFCSDCGDVVLTPVDDLNNILCFDCLFMAILISYALHQTGNVVNTDERALTE